MIDEPTAETRAWARALLARLDGQPDIPPGVRGWLQFVALDGLDSTPEVMARVDAERRWWGAEQYAVLQRGLARDVGECAETFAAWARTAPLAAHGRRFRGRPAGTWWHEWADQLVAQHGGRRIPEATIWTALEAAADADDSPIDDALRGRGPECARIRGRHQGYHAHILEDPQSGRRRSITFRTIKNQVARRNAQARRRSTSR